MEHLGPHRTDFHGILHLGIFFKVCGENYRFLKIRQEQRALYMKNCGHRGPGASVGIATEYGLDGPGSNPDGDEINNDVCS